MEINEIFSKKGPGNLREDFSVFWQLSRPHSWRLVAAGVCSLALSGINGGIAWMVKPALDSIFIKRSSVFLILLPIGIILLFIMRGVFTFLANYIMSSIGAKIVTELRQGIYNKLLKLPLSFYNATTSGSLISKMLNDVEVLNSTVAHTLKDLLVEGGTVLVLAAVAVIRKWDLAVLSFVVIPLIVYSIARLGRMMKGLSTKTRRLISEVTTILQESLQGMKVIKAFTMEAPMSRRYETALKEHYRNRMRESRTDEFSRLMAEAIGGVGIAMIVYYGGNLVIAGEISTGSFFSFIAAVLLIYTPLKRLSKVANNFQQARTIIERIREIIIAEGEKEDGLERDISGDIRIDHVSFRYPASSRDALTDVSLDIRKGEVIALVGHSGSGKSTLVDLIAGFWYPSGGAIYIDGVRSSELSLHCIREHLGIVSQEIVLFDDTVMANIRFGRPGASDEEVVEAAKAAYAHDFISELPGGYETRIGERGIMLSGGQKQRITIARAILRDPAILLLDEATSSLDMESEQKVRLAMEKLMAERTTVVIAHRISTVKNATRIAVMNRGVIVQQGSHEELILQGGLYQELYNMQFAGSEEK